MNLRFLCATIALLAMPLNASQAVEGESPEIEDAEITLDGTEYTVSGTVSSPSFGCTVTIYGLGDPFYSVVENDGSFQIETDHSGNPGTVTIELSDFMGPTDTYEIDLDQ